MRTPVSLPARARLRFALLAFLFAISACDNSSEPELVPAPEFRPCVDYGDHLRLSGSVPVDGFATDLLIDNGFLYAALDNKVQIFDLSNEDSPTLISVVDVPAQDLAMADEGRLCVAADRQLGILDVSDPATAIIASTLNLPVSVDDIAARGDRAYLAAKSQGLWVVDLSVSSQPRIMGSVDTPYHAWAVGLSGNLALVACADDPARSGLQVIDITNPASPQRYSFLGGVFGRNVEIEGQIAFLCGLSYETFAVDISTPTFPALLAAIPLGNQAIAVDGDRAYTCGSAFAVHSILNPASPVSLGAIDTRANVMALDGDRAYLSYRDRAPNRLEVVDVADPRSLQPLARMNLQTSTWRMAARSTAIYLCTGSSFMALAVQNQMPSIQWRIPLEGFDVALDDSCAYVASLERGLTIVDVNSDPGRIIGEINLPGYAAGVATKDHQAFIALYDYGLWIVDVEDPARCRILGSVDTPGQATDVAIRDSFAFVTDSFAGLIVVDTSAATSPRIVGAAGNPSFQDASAVALSGDFAFVAARRGGLGIFDISQPTKPDFIATVATESTGRDVIADGSFVYMVGEDLLVIDVTDPRFPVIVGSTPSDFSFGVALDDTRVFLSQDWGVTVFPRHCEGSTGGRQ